MTSVAEAVKPGGIFDEPIDLADCNPELLKQLARQEAANRQPIIMRGCEVSIYRTTVSVKEGIVFLPGRWMTWVPAKCFTLAPANAYNPRIDSVVLRAYDHEWDSTGKTGPEVQIITGTSTVLPLEPTLPADAIKLASIFADPMAPPTLFLSEGQDLRDEVMKRVHRRKELQDSCSHVGVVRTEVTNLSDPEQRYLVVCRGCDLSWDEYECGRCGERNPGPRACPCRAAATVIDVWEGHEEQKALVRQAKQQWRDTARRLRSTDPDTRFGSFELSLKSSIDPLRARLAYEAFVAKEMERIKRYIGAYQPGPVTRSITGRMTSDEVAEALRFKGVVD